jgi:hypothetical protein
MTGDTKAGCVCRTKSGALVVIERHVPGERWGKPGWLEFSAVSPDGTVDGLSGGAFDEDGAFTVIDGARVERRVIVPPTQFTAFTPEFVREMSGGPTFRDVLQPIPRQADEPPPSDATGFSRMTTALREHISRGLAVLDGRTGIIPLEWL